MTLTEQLKEQNIDHKLWMEQPENIPTCIAVKPYPKAQIQSLFKKYKLFKGTLPKIKTATQK